MKFEWDEGKASSNLAKHGVAFSEAIEVFADPALVVVETIRERDGEDRLKAMGRRGGRVFAVVFTRRGSVFRLISARPANPGEVKRYGLGP